MIILILILIILLITATYEHYETLTSHPQRVNYHMNEIPLYDTDALRALNFHTRFPSLAIQKYPETYPRDVCYV